MALLALHAPSWAANRYWDVNGTTAGRGGTGIWSAADAFWGPNINGTTGPHTGWNNAALDDAFFGGTAATVTLGEPITAHNLTFEITGYTITGNTLTLGGLTPTITSNPGVTATIGSSIAGSAGLTKAGTGTLLLSGANTFSGGINVNAGVLNITGDAALGAAGNGIVMANGTQLVANTGAGGSNLAAGRMVTLTSGSVGVSGSRVGSARFTGTGGLNLIGPVNLSNNANDYTGQTQITGAGGTYSFNSIADLGVASALGAPTTVANGTVLLAPTSGTPILAYTGTGNASNRSFELRHVAGTQTRLRNAGSGTLTLTGNIALTGASGSNSTFEAIGGDLVLLGVISSPTTVRGAIFSGSVGRTITLGGANTWTSIVSILSGVTVVAPVLANRGSVSSLGTASASVDTIGISGNSQLSYSGTGSSTNRGWSLSNGTLRNDGSGALTLSGMMTLANTGTLAGTFTGAANSISGVISGTGTLAVNTAGTWILSGANTYTGGTTINAGTLQIGHNNFSGSIVGDVVNNGTLAFGRTNFMTFDGAISGTGHVHQLSSGTTKLTGNSSYTGGTTVSAGTLEIGNGGTSGAILGDVTNNSILAFDRADAVTFDGDISGTGAVTKLGPNTLTLTGNNSYAGDTTISAGTLQLGDGGASGTLGAGAVTLAGGTSLAFNRSDSITINNTISGTGTLAQIGAGTTALTNTVSVAATTIAGGVLDAATGASLTSPTIALIAASPTGAALHVHGTTNAGAGAATVITGSGSNHHAVAVFAGGSLLGNTGAGELGAGNDTLDVAGTLDTVGGVFNLGFGDDTFTLRDGASVVGAIDGGAGTNTLNTHIDGIAELGASTNFQVLTKTGSGTLNINGPQTSIFDAVFLQGGTLYVAAGATVDPQTTDVGTGTTFTVDGLYNGTSGADTFTVAGTVNGTGTIDLLDGDDVLTLNDGADLGGLANPLDGGAHGTGDTVTLNNAGALAFAASNVVNFERLQKANTGVATLTGTSTFASTAIDGGTLDVDGTLNTGPITLADGVTLNVDGTVQAAAGMPTAITGSAGTNTVAVGTGGFLLASGDLGDGADVLDVTGTLDATAGAFDLGAGDDTFTVHDGTNVIGNVDGDAGLDTRVYDIDGTASLGALLNFEGLTKTGTGVLNIDGPGATALAEVQVLGGTLTMGSGATLASQDTTVAAGTTLDVQGAFTGTASNDTFATSGTVRGALAFGSGDDDATFSTGSDFSGLTGLSGGAGSDDLNFNGLVLTSTTLPPFDAWETLNLRAGSTLMLSAPLDLTSNGLLSIDATSHLIATAGARLTGSLGNAGRISVGGTRLGISNDYSASGSLALAVSPGSSSSGGLDIGGDVTGTTHVLFTSDGTQATQQPGSILVISSPNDNRSTAGSFAPANTVRGLVRLDGIAFPWLFNQQADNNWYLTAAILPEVAGYAVLPSIGQAGIQESNRLLFDRLSGVRDDTRRCEAGEDTDRRGYAALTGDCEGAWVAATGSELEIGADPGFAFSGDNLGLYVGVDTVLQDRATRTLRGGMFAGFQRGNYWTTGESSTAMSVIGEANVRTDTPTIGMYGSVNWSGGTYVDVSLVGQRPKATVAADGATDEDLTGNSVTLGSQLGHRFPMADGWTVEPQLQVSASAVHWQDKVDASGQQVLLNDDVLGLARAAVRAEKVFETDGGARIHPWATLGLQETIGEKDNAVAVGLPGPSAPLQAYPNQELGLVATLDVGVEAELNERASLFGALSYGHSVDGSESEQRQVNLGIRVRW